MEGECLANTVKNTDWAYKSFESWHTARNQQFAEAQCPDDVFSSKHSENSYIYMTIYTRVTHRRPRVISTKPGCEHHSC